MTAPAARHPSDSGHPPQARQWLVRSARASSCAVGGLRSCTTLGGKAGPNWRRISPTPRTLHHSFPCFCLPASKLARIIKSSGLRPDCMYTRRLQNQGFCPSLVSGRVSRPRVPDRSPLGGCGNVTGQSFRPQATIGFPCPQPHGKGATRNAASPGRHARGALSFTCSGERTLTCSADIAGGRADTRPPALLRQR